MDSRCGESAELKIRRDQRHDPLCTSRFRWTVAQKDLIPVNTKASDDSKLAAGGEETQIDRHGLRLSGRYSQVFDDRFPETGRILHLQVGHNQSGLVFLRC